MSRTKKSIKNIKYTLIGQVLSLIVNFISRAIFVRYLSAEYLGLNGLFSNVLSILTLAELGIGSAIVFSLYEPLAKGEKNKVKSLMQIYKKAYITIGIFTLISGLVIMPFLNYFIKEMPNIPNLNLIFILFVVNTSISYFFSYKRSIIIADQKRHIDSLYHFSSIVLLNILQITVLVITRNYIFFLSLKIIFTFIENVLLSLKANKMYPYLNENTYEKLNKVEQKNIFNNIKAMFLHRFGAVIVMGTDNLLLSKFVGIVSVGLYSNYILILSGLKMLINIIFQSITASVGNLGALENKDRINDVFNSIDFITYWIYSFASIALMNLFNPFISIWLGEDYLFEISIVLVIVINFYIQGQRKSVLTFRDALGLFWHDRYKPALESILNLLVSIYLTIKLGVSGVIIGTIVSTLITSTWIEPLVLYKFGLHKNVRIYYYRYLKRFVLTIINGSLTWLACTLITSQTFVGFISKLMLCVIIPNLFLLLIYHNSSEFRQLIKLIKKERIYNRI